MKVVTFKCNENCNKYTEEIEFEDDVSQETIEETFVDWVWEQVGDRFSWDFKEIEND